jgi:hypothetical protein
MKRRRSDVHLTQIGQGVFERQGYIPQLCIPHIPAFLAYHHQDKGLRGLTDDQLTSLIYIVNDSELHTVDIASASTFRASVAKLGDSDPVVEDYRPVVAGRTILTPGANCGVESSKIHFFLML